jgi:hypothetical protein
MDSSAIAGPFIRDVLKTKRQLLEGLGLARKKISDLEAITRHAREPGDEATSALADGKVPAAWLLRE